jgi:hypothetical protein
MPISILGFGVVVGARSCGRKINAPMCKGGGVKPSKKAKLKLWGGVVLTPPPDP